MKNVLFALLTLCVTPSLSEAGTAYEAMRVVGTLRGEGSLHQVIEVRGTITGAVATQKATRWTILAIEPGKGLREYQVINDKIAAERVIKDGRVAAMIDLNKLNVDSDGAQTLVDREAKTGAFKYDLADYILRGNRGGAPLWEVSLTDTQTATVNTLTISADTGIILKAGEIAGESDVEELPPINTDVANSDEPMAEGEREEEVEKEGTKVSRFFKRVGRHMVRRKDQLDEKLHNVFGGGNDEPAKRSSDSAPVKPAERPRD